MFLVKGKDSGVHDDANHDEGGRVVGLSGNVMMLYVHPVTEHLVVEQEKRIVYAAINL